MGIFVGQMRGLEASDGVGQVRDGGAQGRRI